MKSFTLFKYLVLPALLLCAVIKKAGDAVDRTSCRPALDWPHCV